MAGDTVTVACKLPGGLHAHLLLDDGAKVFVTFAGSGAERRLQRADDAGRPITVDPDMVGSVRGGFGLTPNVDKAWWDAWLKQNGEYPPVKKGLIFASAQHASAIAKTKDHAEIRNGLEPINPSAPAKGVEPDDRHVKG